MKRHLWPLLLITAAVIAVYSNALRNGFIGDDHLYIELNAFVRDTSNLRYLLDPRFYLGSSEVLAGNRPLLLASLMADRALWGNHPAGFHATNVLLHWANSVWIYGLSAELGLAAPFPLWAALFFGLHPVQTEAVDAISYRSDLLAAFFFFLSLWAYLRARVEKKRKALFWIAASSILFGLALLSKEMAATLPLMVLLLEAYFPSPEERPRRLAFALAAFLAMGCAYVGFWAPRFHYQGMETSSFLLSVIHRLASLMPTAPGPPPFAIGLRKGLVAAPSSWQWSALYADKPAWILALIQAIAGYFRLLVFPFDLTVNRALPVGHHWTDASALLSFASLLLIALYAAGLRRRDPPSAFGAAWCLTALLPVLNLIPLFNPIAERYLYLVTPGAGWALASGFSWLARRPQASLRKIAPVAGALLAFAYGARTYARNQDWKNDTTLYFSNTNVPLDSSAKFIRGDLLRQQGRLGDAIREYYDGLSSSPGEAHGWLGLGLSYAASRQVAPATRCFQKAISLSPNNLLIRFAYAYALFQFGQKQRAIDEYEKVVAMEPDYLEAWVSLGALYMDQGRYRASRNCYEKSLRLAGPYDAAPFYSYGLLLEKMKDYRAAAAQYEAALRRDPTLGAAQQALDRVRLREKPAR